MVALRRRPVDWNDDAPFQVVVERDIAADADAVWKVLADHERWPEWFPGLREVRVTGEPAGVGAQRRVHVKGAGPFDEVFNAWEPGRRFGFSIVEMRVPLFHAVNELITITPADDGVRVRYQQAFEPRGWAAPLLRLADSRLRTGLTDGLDGLARRASQA